MEEGADREVWGEGRDRTRFDTFYGKETVVGAFIWVLGSPIRFIKIIKIIMIIIKISY